MLIVSLQGGLGNQMFQYAFGRGMSVALDRRLILDLTTLPTGSGEHRRPYGLDSLPLRSDIPQLGTGRDGTGHRLMATVGGSARRWLRRWQINEPDADRVLHPHEFPHGLAICSGYWQSPKYFTHIDEEIRRELTPRIHARSRPALVLEQEAGQCLVAVHVRRGDYVQLPRVNAIHGSRTADYFHRAVNSLESIVGDRASVIVLSDDPVWAQENLRFNLRTIHAELDKPLSTVDALAIMSRCQHHVIANSSFSWWGAWLAAWESQRVIYPEPWLVRRVVDADFRFPSNWESSQDHSPSAD